MILSLHCLNKVWNRIQNGGGTKFTDVKNHKEENTVARVLWDRRRDIQTPRNLRFAFIIKDNDCFENTPENAAVPKVRETSVKHAGEKTTKKATAHSPASRLRRTTSERKQKPAQEGETALCLQQKSELYWKMHKHFDKGAKGPAESERG